MPGFMKVAIGLKEVGGIVGDEARHEVIPVCANRISTL